MGVCLVERKGHVDGVGLLLGGDGAVLLLYLHGAGSGFCGVEARYKAVRFALGRSILTKAESIKNGLDSQWVKAVAALRLLIGRGHR